jgi:glucose/arabinose dehydrogenase/mono/diheme cytochrome c family protein
MRTPRWRNLTPALLIALCVSRPAGALAGADASAPVDVELADLRPGLVAHYRSLNDPEAELDRIDTRPTFYLAYSSPHPRIPPGPFEVTWSGVLHVKDPSPLMMDAYVCGELLMEIDGVKVLEGRGQSEMAQLRSREGLKRPAGLYQLKMRYRSLPDRPARLQIWWQGPSFTREPVPAWHFKHQAVESPPAIVQEQHADKGRTLVGRLGCARCHGKAFPGVGEPPPGPSLADLGARVSRSWLLDWLADPAGVRSDARMPALFSADRQGLVERWVLTEHLLGSPPAATPDRNLVGDHRMGRRRFVELGCATCHFLPDDERRQQPNLDRTALVGLAERLPGEKLAAFLANPHSRYPDGRMPRLPIAPQTARDLSAYLLLWSKPAAKKLAALEPPTSQEIAALSRRLRARGATETAQKLLREKGCAQCHTGLGQGLPREVPISKAGEDRGCFSGKSGPRFHLDSATKKAIAAYLAVAGREKHPSPFASRQRLIEHLGCLRCHARDSERPPPIEAIGSTLGGAWLQEVPFQRTPRLYYPLQKYERPYLVRAIREGVSGIRPSRYSYQMPAFGEHAETIVQALAEADGDLPASAEAAARPVSDPTLGPLAGSGLAGFQGYACVSCHVWNGQAFSEPDPGAVGTDLTRLTGRIRRDWFDRYLEGPARFNPATVMPAIFAKGQPASLSSILEGKAARQRDALWSYFALGNQAPAPKPPPPLPVAGPGAGEPPLVALIPVHLPDGKVVESITLLSNLHDLIVYDLSTATIHSGYTAGRILRTVQGRSRTFRVSGTPMGNTFPADPAKTTPGPAASSRTFQGYDRLADRVRIRWRVQAPSGTITLTDDLRLFNRGNKRGLIRELRATEKLLQKTEHVFPPAQSPPPYKLTILPDPGKIEGSLERPGYRAIAYPRPKTASGEDRVMPGAVAVNPRDGRVFVASMKTGELFVVNDPNGDGKNARFDNYAHGLFEEAFSMLAEPDALYVLHRRNLTRIGGKDGKATRFDRVTALPHGIADTYDYAYGLARDKTGAFVFSFAPYANTHLPGSGSALRLPVERNAFRSPPDHKPTEIAFGFRNPVGWCAGPDGEIFFTDNQGEWVATNKLCHLSHGRFYGFPNSAQRQHTTKPAGRAAVWVPYGWAKSINGVAYNNTGDKFGPFTGQVFLAELMFGGAIIRANVEKVNGEYQGACFPFWGRGLLGPLTLAFDPRGKLWVGGITEPGWMVQPDRGALFRIDFTGKVPFEMKSIHALPRGFRIVFTKPVSPASARDPASYHMEHYRYEYTGAYGSPELDRTRLAIERIELSPDSRSVDLTTAALVKDRVYMVQAHGVRSADNERLVQPVGAYTMNEVPSRQRE